MPTTTTEQGALTVIVEIKRGEKSNLNKLLKDIKDNVDKDDCRIDFSQLTKVHFMRWVVLDEVPLGSGEAFPAQLVLSTNYDLPLKDHLEELVTVGGATMQAIYSHCVGYEIGTNLYNYLTQPQYNSKPNAFYIGTPGLGVALIRREKAFREGIQRFLDRPDSAIAPGPDAAQRAVEGMSLRVRMQAFVLHDDKLRWASEPEVERPSKLRRIATGLLFVLVVLFVAFVALCLFVPRFAPVPGWALPVAGAVLVVALILFLVGFVVVWLQVLKVKENAPDEKGDPVTIDADRIGKLTASEDRLVQNQLTHLADIKSGWFRLATLRIVLAFINFMALNYYVHGTLYGIPTIHFGRWVVIDKGRRLLFFSNYDGSWVNYLGDFIDKAAPGLTAIWSNTVGCPKSQGLYGEGATDEQRFKSWTRNHQIITQVWYSAYEDLTVDNIHNNHKIRVGLFGNLNAAEEQAWLSLL